MKTVILLLTIFTAMFSMAEASLNSQSEAQQREFKPTSPFQDKQLNGLKEILQSKLDERSYKPNAIKCGINPKAAVYFRYTESDLKGFDWSVFNFKVMSYNEGSLNLNDALLAIAYLRYYEENKPIRALNVCEVLKDLELIPGEKDLAFTRERASQLYLLLRFLDGGVR
jgi:hypothetical protein